MMASSVDRRIETDLRRAMGQCDLAGLIRPRSTDPIRACGHWPRRQAGHMTASDLQLPTRGKVLASRGPSTHDPATHEAFASDAILDNTGTMKGGWVYIMTNRPNDTLYVGTTADLARRAWEHRNGVVEGFTKQGGLSRLVYAERYEDILIAKQHERNIKHWPRAWKVRLILRDNPNWDDLYGRLA